MPRVGGRVNGFRSVGSFGNYRREYVSVRCGVTLELVLFAEDDLSGFPRGSGQNGELKGFPSVDARRGCRAGTLGLLVNTLPLFE